MWPFSMKVRIVDKPDISSREKKKLDFWRNENQTLFLKGGHKVIVLKGRDVEICWTDAHGEKPYIKGADGKNAVNNHYKDNFEYLVRTKSGGVYSLTKESWMKCRLEDPDFKCVN